MKRQALIAFLEDSKQYIKDDPDVHIYSVAEKAYHEILNGYCSGPNLYVTDGHALDSITGTVILQGDTFDGYFLRAVNNSSLFHLRRSYGKPDDPVLAQLLNKKIEAKGILTADGFLMWDWKVIVAPKPAATPIFFAKADLSDDDYNRRARAIQLTIEDAIAIATNAKVGFVYGYIGTEDLARAAFIRPLKSAPTLVFCGHAMPLTPITHGDFASCPSFRLAIDSEDQEKNSGDFTIEQFKEDIKIAVFYAQSHAGCIHLVISEDLRRVIMFEASEAVFASGTSKEIMENCLLHPASTEAYARAYKKHYEDSGLKAAHEALRARLGGIENTTNQKATMLNGSFGSGLPVTVTSCRRGGASCLTQSDWIYDVDPCGETHEINIIPNGFDYKPFPHFDDWAAMGKPESILK